MAQSPVEAPAATETSAPGKSGTAEPGRAGKDAGPAATSPAAPETVKPAATVPGQGAGRAGVVEETAPEAPEPAEPSAPDAPASAATESATSSASSASTTSAPAAAGQVTGCVVDRTGEPVPGVAVVMLDRDSLYVAAAASDARGCFRIASRVRPYRLLFQHLSYRMQRLEGSADNVGVVTLDASETAIEGVVVNAERPVVRVEEGRLDYDLEAATRGMTVNNAYEAITRLPGVSEQEGRLTLAGAGSVTVILNGKPTTMSTDQLEALLRSTPVERVERAEVMYSAPPQYHVRGAAINIVLRHGGERAFSGQLHGQYANSCFGAWEGGANVVYTSPKWSADLNYTGGTIHNRRYYELRSLHDFDGERYDIAQSERITQQGSYHRLRAALDWSPSEQSRLSAAYTAAFNPSGEGLALSSGSFVDSRSLSRTESQMHNLALRYRAPFGLELGADYTSYRNPERSEQRNDYASGSQNAFDIVSGQLIDRVNVTADQQVALGGRWKLNTGGALSWAGSHDWQRYLPREGSIEAVDTESSLDEYTANLYAGASRTLSKGSLSFSLAGEYYRMGSYENWALYPQASFNWMFSEEHMLQLTLSSDKSYPSYWEMQGAVSYVDGYSEIHGSPGLRPAKNYSAQALYMLRSKYIFMLFWNETLDYFTQSAWQSSERLALIYQTLNWDTNRQWGANVIIPFKAGRWLESRLVFTGLQLTQRCDRFHDIGFDRSKWVGIVRMDNTFRLSRKPDLTLDLSGHYQSAAIQATYDVEPVWQIDAGARWSFARGRASLTVRCTDLFGTSMPYTKIRYRGQHLDMDSGFYTRTFTARLTFRFGGYKERRHDSVDTSRFGH